MEIIKDTKLNELDFSKLNDKSKWENIDDLISDFITCLPFTDTASQQDKTMMINFIKFMFYQLSYKSFTKKVNLIFLKKSPYTIENKIAVNKSKRSFYYDFLDSFKYKPNYNITLIKLLKILL
ncbi:hypothetical protein [Mycoplasmopsis glycophila]|uniref:hypothetical protein n=1 Tax=Mycoplasmopsis glycophila TaxID=171285 RepID=UPI00101B80CE|nr:hypothetical protein [Mycoplasmopsis glycophila]